ncbi:MAG: phosphoribosylaminoimidazolesuccinocarboxamide synthase [Caldilineaceae bacterium]|nr:phosphoribosylaminoimidazolesuccinocarboxamide synthase [Caldilineaceae bacterium]
MQHKQIADVLPHAFDGVDLPFLGTKFSGKVREIYNQGEQLILITTDRLSAFDRILGLVPYKGQVLNQLSAFWFEQTRDIVGNHFLSSPDPNVTVGRKCRPLPVEVVVRGFISGVTKTALWYRYSQGERLIYGIDFPDGLRKNDPLPQPIITPTTKAREGGHDERITSAEVVEHGLVDAQTWARVQEAAVSLFRRGQEIARRGGLILVDTKYEFGLSPDGEILLIDEVHTPDSSRFWLAENYAARHAAGEEPENFDKEFIRLYYAEHGYRGDGDPFPLPADLAIQAAQRYIHTYEMITGRGFEPDEYPIADRVRRRLKEMSNQ